MKKYTPLLLILLVLACANNKPSPARPDKPKAPSQSIGSLLTSYFSTYEISPILTINNTSRRQDKIILAGHKIQWLVKNEETMIKIDNDLFTLKGKATLNPIWDDGKDTVDDVCVWDEVKLYNINHRELICISMGYVHCNGLACSLRCYLVYDPTTRRKNFFGSIYTSGDINLYDFKNDDKIDYVASAYFEDDSEWAKRVYVLYSMDKNGQFNILKTEKSSSYSLKHTFSRREPTKADTLEQHWITKIK